MVVSLYIGAIIELQDPGPAGRVIREGLGSARVIVAVTSGELSEPITVRVLTANINAVGRFKHVSY